MIEWKWNDGTRIEKSPRIVLKRENESEVNLNEPSIEDFSTTVNVYHSPDLSSVPKASVLNENQAYLQSLEIDQQFRESSTKREESWEKMASRDMVGQMGQNPFFYQEGKTNSYANDLSALNQFMQPTRETSSSQD